MGYKIKNQRKEINERLKQLKAKEQECEELKKEIAFGNNGTLSDKIRAEVFKELNNENDQLKAAKEQTEQKLERIKDICKNVMPTGIDEETDKFDDILQIIDEVER